MTKEEFKLSEQLFTEGVELYEQEKLVQAEEKFLLALELQPESEEIMYNLALAYFEQKKYDLSYAIADRIRFLDCDELFLELDKAGYKPKYPIPDDIPEKCEDCEHFRPGSVIRDEGGFCLFYQQHVRTSASCLVQGLVDEGKVSPQEIEQNRNKRHNQLLEQYLEKVKDENLPPEMVCEKCSTLNKLTQIQRAEKRFVCSHCAALTDLHSKIEELAPEMKQKTDRELFVILVQADDFRAEFCYAACKEILRRGIDLKENQEFISVVKA